jgi:hypothetical protein
VTLTTSNLIYRENFHPTPSNPNVPITSRNPLKEVKFPTISGMTSKGLITSLWESTSHQSRTKIDFLKVAHTFPGEEKRMHRRQQGHKNLKGDTGRLPA